MARLQLVVGRGGTMVAGEMVLLLVDVARAVKATVSASCVWLAFMLLHPLSVMMGDRAVNMTAGYGWRRLLSTLAGDKA
jgi:hypothetical protein